MRKIAFLFVMLAFVGCGEGWVEDARPKVYIESFEKEAGEDYAYSYGFESEQFEFEYFHNTEFGYWGGFAHSELKDSNAENGHYENQYAVFNDKAATGDGFLVYYYDSYNEPCDIVIKKSYALVGVRLNLSTYTYASITNEDINSYARVFADGDYLKVIFTAMLGNQAGNKVECYVADFRDGKSLMATEWNSYDLTALGDSYDSVRVTIETSDVGEWGANTPLYICIDDLSFMEVKKL